jgi:hypothetical protein
LLQINIIDKEITMDKIPVFDRLGNKVGDFLPAGMPGAGAAIAGAALFIILYCLPCINVIAPPIAFIWAITRPNSYKHKKTAVIVTGILLLLWTICHVIYSAMGIVRLIEFNANQNP